MTAIRIYLSYGVSYRQVEELMIERGIKVDHTTIYQWVIKFTPKILKKFKKHKLKVGMSWFLDETYIKVAGQWYYLYRAVDSEGFTIDFQLYKRRNKNAAFKYLKKAINENGVPLKINIDKSGQIQRELTSLIKLMALISKSDNVNILTILPIKTTEILKGLSDRFKLSKIL